MPEFINNLPDNFTLEFDFIYSGSNSFRFCSCFFYPQVTAKTAKQVLNAEFNYNKRSGINLGIQPIQRDKGGFYYL